MVKCTRRCHATAAPLRKACAEGQSLFIKFCCTNCGKDLVGCRECARNNGGVQCAYRDPNHLKKDHSKKRGCGRNGRRRREVPRTSMRNSPKTISSPRLSIVQRLSTRLARQGAVQLVSGLIPSLHVGHTIPLGGALDGLACMYDGADGAPIPTGVSAPDLGNYIGKEISNQFIEAINDSGFVLEAGKSISIFKYGEGNGAKYTLTHSDNHAVLLLVLGGQKNVWLGGREVSTGAFLDTAGREWVSLSNEYDSTTSHFWDLGENSMVGEHNDMEGETQGHFWDLAENNGVGDIKVFVQKMRAFRRATIGPGDALLIPRRFLHTLSTAPKTTSISAIVRLKK